MPSNEATTARLLKALGSEKRLTILSWLRDPRAHFREQVDGDLVEDGVCGVLIAEKLGVGQPTVSEHMRILVQAGLVIPARTRKWTFYRRNEPAIAAARKAIADSF